MARSCGRWPEALHRWSRPTSPLRSSSELLGRLRLSEAREFRQRPLWCVRSCGSGLQAARSPAEGARRAHPRPVPRPHAPRRASAEGDSGRKRPGHAQSPPSRRRRALGWVRTRCLSDRRPKRSRPTFPSRTRPPRRSPPPFVPDRRARTRRLPYRSDHRREHGKQSDRQAEQTEETHSRRATWTEAASRDECVVLARPTSFRPLIGARENPFSLELGQELRRSAPRHAEAT